MGFFFSKDLGIDLGTANTLVFAKGKGVVLSEPSVVAYNKDSDSVLAVGVEAKEMIGRTPGNIVAIRPMQDGVIADYETTKEMLYYFINKALRKGLFQSRPRVLICVPSGVTEVEIRAVRSAAIASGAKRNAVYLIEEPMAAAIGAGLDVGEPTGSMIIDIGGGTSEMAVISLYGVVTSTSLRVAGDAMDTDIINFIKKEYSLAIGERTAEDLKINIGCVFQPNPKETMEVRGRDLISGLPKTVIISSVEISEAISESIESILESIKATLERTPPELAADIIERGIVLTGGGAKLRGLDELIESEIEIPVFVAENPLNCVAIGTGLVLEQLDEYKGVLLN